MEVDVAIIGGGPAGSTLGTLLKKYNPGLEVVIFEREIFPRDHVGESQLPPISHVLNEMGCWDKVEAANFPIKIGATYRWGRTPELWDFEFLPATRFKNEPRPGKFEGQRRVTAFQVDRSIYDEILLDHAAEMGCDVREGTKVVKIDREGDRVTGLQLASGEQVHARYYADASGHAGLLRRAMNVRAEYPSSLQNVAFWDCWQNADWAVEIGVGATRVQILSLDYGWIWFIPLSPTRTSVGLVIPAEYYKQSGKRPEELYAKALEDEKRVASLMAHASSEGKFQTTKDWSFLAERMVGENWFLVGESAGFADPILSAGLSLAHAGAREAAYTILELDRSLQLPEWLKEQYTHRQRARITSHIRFADYWYTANAQFTDLKQYTQKIAEEAGLELTPDKAWAWLAQGGFINEDLQTGAGGYSLATIKSLGQFLTEIEPDSPLETCNVFRLDLSGATWKERAQYTAGRVLRTPAYVRADRVLPVYGPYEFLVNALQATHTMQGLIEMIKQAARRIRGDQEAEAQFVLGVIQALDALVSDGWVIASYDPEQPLAGLKNETIAVHWNADDRKAPTPEQSVK